MNDAVLKETVKETAKGKVKIKRNWLAKEVIQTSEGDCEVAALKCILDSYGVDNNYEYLRDACKTDIQGATIDRMEEVLNEIGFDCQQAVVATAHITLKNHDLLPAITQVISNQNVAHFVVIWRQFGPWLQILDPAQGRYWIKATQFAEQQQCVYHNETSPKNWQKKFEQWQRPWFLDQLSTTLGINKTPFAQAMQDRNHINNHDNDWQPGAKVDAILRFISFLAKQDKSYHGEKATRLFSELLAKINQQSNVQQWYDIIPESFWCCRPSNNDNIQYNGALLLKIRPSEQLKKAQSRAPTKNKKKQSIAGKTLSPIRALFDFMTSIGVLTPSVVIFSALVVTMTMTLQVVSLKMLLEFESLIDSSALRSQIALIMFLLVCGIAIVSFAMNWVMRKIARHLEDQFRIAMYEKLPKLKDEYYASRLLPDLIERCHSVTAIAKTPKVVVDSLMAMVRITIIFIGLLYISPDDAPFLIVFFFFCLALPILAKNILSQKDLVARTLAGTLTRHYSNALLGLFTVKVHSGENTILNQQQESLTRWATASNNERQAYLKLTFIQDIITYGMAIILISYTVNTMTIHALNILYVFWVLKLPARAEQLLNSLERVPKVKNTVLRLQEPLSSVEDEIELAEPQSLKTSQQTAGMALQINKGSFSAGGQSILNDININIKPATHLAVVGGSGAGKSTFVSSLLGFGQLDSGEVLVDGDPLTPSKIACLRQQSSWLDPQVYLFKDSIVENILYGSTNTGRIGNVLDEANLWPLIEGLPDSIHTDCGEAGSKLSGGEGQRIRLARALNKPNVRLALLDEPFRGLDKPTRMALMKTVREKWRDQTLICVSHDVSEALQFDQIAVFENGKIVEQGSPEQLLKNNGPLQRLLDFEASVATQWLGNANWRRVSVDQGKSTEVKT
ncbi:MAG: ATP-binding cassette domain-containing protein [Algicola sp.]|nr:ATP-binding cassette domain-containing protein [Algicola sp.]